MCDNCWTEDYGAPTAVPEHGEQTVALIQELYSREDGDTGALLHVLLDDFNLEDSCVRPFRQYETEYTDRTVQLCELISEQMAAMTEDQRAAVIAKAHGWF